MTFPETISVVTQSGCAYAAIIPYTESVFRVLISPKQTFSLPDYQILVPDLEPSACSHTFQKQAGAVTLSTKAYSICLSTATGAITVSDNAGNLCFQQPTGASFTPVPVTHPVFSEQTALKVQESADGVKVRAADPAYEILRTAYQISIPISFQKAEAIYGFGSLDDGTGNLRGKKAYLYQQNLRAFVPMMLSTQGYGILFHTGGSMIYDDAKAHAITLDCADELDLFFLCGTDHTAIMQAYYTLTGPVPLMPKYLLGYIQSKEHYASSEELIDIVTEYRRRQIPLDVIVQDWQSWEEGKWGQKTMDPARYPDPSALTETLHNLHARLQLSIWPTMSGDCPNQLEMLAHGYMLGNRTNYNPFLENARRLYWKQTKEGLYDHGADLWWCDCTEPFEADWFWDSNRNKPDEAERYQINTAEAKKYLDCDRISLYSLYHAKGIFEGMRSCTDKRVANLTRSSYAGQHRYATITWSGDIEASWNRLRAQIPAGANFTATGESFWSVDIGAFFTRNNGFWFWRGDYNDGVSDYGYREFYTRFLQYGTFLPVMRSHGTDTPREIWHFGEPGDVFYDTIAAYIRLRYQLMPYLYSLCAANTFQGKALMLPLGLAYPHDLTAHDIKDQYLFGDMMICPVTEPMYYDVHSVPISEHDKCRSVYLPAGTCWYDYHTGKKYTGGQTIRAYAPIDVIPIFIPEGTILVTGPVMQYTDEIICPPITITVYPGKDAAFTLYEDDGETYQYVNGDYTKTHVFWDDTKKQCHFTNQFGHTLSEAALQRFTVQILS